RGGAGRRSADPHGRRATAERFSAVGERVRRAALRPAALARLRRGRPHRRGARLPPARATLRRSRPGGPATARGDAMTRLVVLWLSALVSAALGAWVLFDGAW